MRNVMGWDLPPGVSVRDIERAQGDGRNTDDDAGDANAEAADEAYAAAMEKLNLPEPCDECGFMGMHGEGCLTAAVRKEGT